MRKIIYPNQKIYSISPCKDCPENITDKTITLKDEESVEIFCKTNECINNIIGFEYIQKVEIKDEKDNTSD
jgi:hypothetical protein